MKELIHFEEWKDKGIELNTGSGVQETDVLRTKSINPYWQKPTKAQEALYKYLKETVEMGVEPHESKIFEIYSTHVKPPHSWIFRRDSTPEENDERIHKNSRLWFKQALASLVLLGWFGLQFKRQVA
jgi:hypothetical protein